MLPLKATSFGPSKAKNGRLTSLLLAGEGTNKKESMGHVGWCLVRLHFDFCNSTGICFIDFLSKFVKIM
jgi:hypothetical protein